MWIRLIRHSFFNIEVKVTEVKKTFEILMLHKCVVKYSNVCAKKAGEQVVGKGQTGSDNR